MRKFNFLSCFLFQSRCPDRRRAPLFWMWNLLALTAVSCGAGVLSLVLARGQYSREIFFDYFRNPMICLLNLLPPVLLVLLLYGLLGRAWLAFLAGSAVVLGASAGNYFKLKFRDDPFLFSDIADIPTAAHFSGQYGVSPDRRLVFCLFFAALGTVFLFLLVRGRPGRRGRIVCTALSLAACFAAAPLYVSESVYQKTRSFDHANQWSATEVFLSRGFVYPFLHSIPDAFPEKPAGYSPQAALEILEEYVPEDIPEERRVNVIGIQLEAFNDLERLGFTGIDPSVYAGFHTLEAQSLSGSLFTDIFAGGTVQTERSFLTGFSRLDNFRRDTGSYVRYFKEQGYAVEGSHPCFAYFYNRLNVNRYLGFDDYWYVENRYNEMVGNNVAFDDVLFPDILELYRSRDKDRPYFHFTVTYQGHGPYNAEELEVWDKAVLWDGPRRDESTFYILNNYLALVRNTGDHLLDLAEALRHDEAPVVLVVFGDHNPWLGNGNSVYQDQGIDLDVSAEAGFRNYYATRYLIWGNDAAKAVLGRELVGEGPDVSPCFLMNLLFEECGLGRGGAFMQAAEDLRRLTPVVSLSGVCLEADGTFTAGTPETAQDALRRYEYVQYFRKQHPEW